ncbi:MAG: exo-alpha-sialidase [Bacteroidetes bacterium]|nr:MAG: exo-alpha-sialidase [Bacteroidota bacterium]
MRIFLLILLAGLGPGLVAQSAFPNILIDNDARGYPPSEPSIAINPRNPQELVAGAILDRVYTSRDGGLVWQKATLNSTLGVFGDPCLLADRKGTFYYLHLSNPGGGGWNSPRLLDRIVCQASRDGGKTWTDGGSIGLRHPKDQDKEWAAAHPRRKRLYVTWTEFDAYESHEPEDRSRILFSQSRNRGKTWSEPVVLSAVEGDCLDDDGTTEGAVPAVGPEGNIYVAWALNEKIYFDRSIDGGKTWLDTDQVVADQPGGWTITIPGINRANGMPVTACDLSQGPYRGSVYVHWADQRNGSEDTDLWVIASRDGGDTWTEPIRINDDGSGHQQFFSWLAVDPVTGYLYTVFYDRRAYDDLQTDVYLAWSRDGGQSWQNSRISEKPFVPDAGVFFGDYSHLAVYDGHIRPIWTRMDDGRTSVWTALIEAKDLK